MKAKHVSKVPTRRPRPPFVLPWHVGPTVLKSEFQFGTFTARIAGPVIATVRGYTVHQAEPLPIQPPESEDDGGPTSDPDHLAALLIRRKHDPLSAYRLLRMAVDAVRCLNEVAEREPAALKPIARITTHWPVLISPNPKRNVDPLDILRKLDVAGGLSTAEDAHSKANVDDTAARTVRALLDYLLFLSTRRHIPPLTVDAITGAARALPPLTKESAADWWRVAELALRETYPDPLAVPELRAIVPKSRKAPSRARSTLLMILRKRFEAMAKPPA